MRSLHSLGVFAFVCTVGLVAACGGKTMGSADLSDGPEAGSAGSGGDSTGGSGGTGGFGGTGGVAGGAGSSTGGTGGVVETGGQGGVAGQAGTAGAAGGPQACTMTVGMADCDECIQTVCESQCIDAQYHPDLPAYFECTEACHDQACYEDCAAQHPEVDAAFMSVYECMDSEDCVIPCHGAVHTACNLATSDQECTVCVQIHCETICVAAQDEPGFEEYFDCLVDCGDDACMDQCDADYPNVHEALGVLTDCAKTVCAPKCDFLG